MSEHIKYNAAKLLEQMRSRGFRIDEDTSKFIIGQQQNRESPLYLRVLVGMGALIASFCFIHFSDVVGIINFNNAKEVIIWSIAFIIGSIILQKIRSNNSSILNDNSLMQVSLMFMVIGKILFVSGVKKILGYDWGTTQGLLIITCATYYIYNVSIDRFSSSFAVLISILVNIVWGNHIVGSREIMMNVFFLLQLISLAALLTYGKGRKDYVPLFYALVFSLYTSVMLLSFKIEFGNYLQIEKISPEFINVVLAGGLIALFVLVADDMQTEPLVLASLTVMLLGAISAPGILLTIGLLVLGHARHEKPLTISGVILLPIFILLYYSNLDISSLQKSGVLIGSGAVLLIARCYLKYRGWDKGGVSCVQK